MPNAEWSYDTEPMQRKRFVLKPGQYGKVTVLPPQRGRTKPETFQSSYGTMTVLPVNKPKRKRKRYVKPTF